LLSDGDFFYFETHKADTEDEALEKFKKSVAEVYGLPKFPSYFSPWVIATSETEMKVVVPLD